MPLGPYLTTANEAPSWTPCGDNPPPRLFASLYRKHSPRALAFRTRGTNSHGGAAAPPHLGFGGAQVAGRPIRHHDQRSAVVATRTEEFHRRAPSPPQIKTLHTRFGVPHARNGKSRRRRSASPPIRSRRLRAFVPLFNPASFQRFNLLKSVLRQPYPTTTDSKLVRPAIR